MNDNCECGHHLSKHGSEGCQGTNFADGAQRKPCRCKINYGGATAPEWQSWTMITAGDGRHFVRGAGSAWCSVDGRADWLDDDEIAALGPVRRCVPVALPDDWERWFGLEDGQLVVRLKRATPDILWEVGAAMLAFARYSGADRD